MSKSESPSQKRREREKQRRREDLINEATLLFIEKGFSDTSMDKIASNAGFTKATVYNYFNTKDELLLAVSARSFTKFNDVLKNLLERTDQVSFAVLQNAIQQMVWDHPDDIFIMNSPILRPLLIAIMDKERQYQDLSQNELLFRTAQIESITLFNDTIRKSLTKIDIKPDETLFELVSNLLTQIGPSFMSELVTREQFIGQTRKETENLVSLFFRIFEAGLKKEIHK